MSPEAEPAAEETLLDLLLLPRIKFELNGAADPPSIELQKENSNWLLLRRGLFNRNAENVSALMAAYENKLSQLGF